MAVIVDMPFLIKMSPLAFWEGNVRFHPIETLGKICGFDKDHFVSSLLAMTYILIGCHYKERSNIKASIPSQNLPSLPNFITSMQELVKVKNVVKDRIFISEFLKISALPTLSPDVQKD